MKFNGIIRNNKLSVYNIQKFSEFIKTLDTLEITIDISKVIKKRSIQENRYYWGVVIQTIADHFKIDDRDFIHDSLRFRFLSDLSPLLLWGAKSTKVLSTSEFEDYMTNIRNWAWESHKLQILKPNEVIMNDDFTFSPIQK